MFCQIEKLKPKQHDIDLHHKTLTENGNKARRKATTPGTSPKSAVGGGRRVSAPPQFPNTGS